MEPVFKSLVGTLPAVIINPYSDSPILPHVCPMVPKDMFEKIIKAGGNKKDSEAEGLVAFKASRPGEVGNQAMLLGFPVNIPIQPYGMPPNHPGSSYPSTFPATRQEVDIVDNAVDGAMTATAIGVGCAVGGPVGGIVGGVVGGLIVGWGRLQRERNHRR
jgi:hypothetical protein